MRIYKVTGKDPDEGTVIRWARNMQEVRAEKCAMRLEYEHISDLEHTAIDFTTDKGGILGMLRLQTPGFDR